MKKIAVVLSGCGVFDGSEIHEAVLTLLSIDSNGGVYQCMAPNVQQTRVRNHLTQKDSDEVRNVLVESARIARGEIINLATAKAEDYSAVIFPGGFGAAINLSNFAEKAADCQLQPAVLTFAKAMYEAKKPLGFLCIAPSLAAKICGPGVKVTIGNDADTAEQLQKMGAEHEDCSVENIIVDSERKVVSTPAYMLGQSISEVYAGIDKLVRHIMLIAG